MTPGISAVLTFAIGVAISPVPIIAVILVLFSRGARVNGPAFLAGWERAARALEQLKDWLGIHNSAVMVVLFLVFGINLIAKGIPVL